MCFGEKHFATPSKIRQCQFINLPNVSGEWFLFASIISLETLSDGRISAIIICLVQVSVVSTFHLILISA